MAVFAHIPLWSLRSLRFSFSFGLFLASLVPWRLRLRLFWRQIGGCLGEKDSEAGASRGAALSLALRARLPPCSAGAAPATLAQGELEQGRGGQGGHYDHQHHGGEGGGVDHVQALADGWPSLRAAKRPSSAAKRMSVMPKMTGAMGSVWLTAPASLSEWVIGGVLGKPRMLLPSLPESHECDFP